MGFFKDINGDAENNVDDLVNVSTDEDVDASLLESLFDGNGDSDDIAVVDEAYDIEDASTAPEEVAEPEPEELPAEDVFAAEPETAAVEEAPAIEEEPVAVEEPAVSSFKALEEEAPKAPAPARSGSNDDQVTVITKGTTINGSIISDCSLNVMGTINGDIECVGKLTISGNVAGNSTASDVFVSAKRLNGNIDSEGTVKVGLGTVVVGDIKAGSAVIAGAVKGELDIQGPIVIDSTAIIKGNVKAKSVQMNNGAILEGFCSLIYSSVSVDDIFE
jgi:cytoskeletal protein CcmA (bactofilin family)